VRSEYGRLDVLVNNAGITGSFQPLEQTRAEDAGAVLDTNVLGVMRVTNAFVPLLAESENARIVNVTSGGGSLRRHPRLRLVRLAHRPARLRPVQDRANPC